MASEPQGTLLAGPAEPRRLPLETELAQRLTALREQGLERSLRSPAGLDFSSNDYLGLAADPELRRRLLARLSEGAGALGAPASRLLSGHMERHAALEKRLARFKGFGAALLFPSGYQANLGLLTALIGPQDRALSDELNHASLIDGLRLSGCRKVIFPHLDTAAVEAELGRPHPGGRTFLVTESLFSMDGDRAPLDRYARLARRFGASVIVDDAHATGLFGEERGSGLVEHHGLENFVTAVVSTCGKALGLGGAFVAAPAVVIDYLVNRSRPFIYSTAVPPLLAEALDVALDLLAEQPERRRRVLALARRLHDRLRGTGLPLPPCSGPIVPVRFGSVAATLRAAEELQRQGFDVRAVRPPTVPAGTSRLRISVHADHREEDLDRLADRVIGLFFEFAEPQAANCGDSP